jgi:hypothetical protein
MLPGPGRQSKFRPCEGNSLPFPSFPAWLRGPLRAKHLVVSHADFHRVLGGTINHLVVKFFRPGASDKPRVGGAGLSKRESHGVLILG